MRLFRATYKDRRGRPQESAKWYVEIRHREVVRRLPDYADKAARSACGTVILETDRDWRSGGDGDRSCHRGRSEVYSGSHPDRA